uniref:Dihydrolipoyllysine-residue acetyltransferase component 2 of pyruvate dehydrogenase complex, mitochondrial n=1 Tax=Lygus hesperus TaxID=30085 RepID=A0A0A9Y3Y8_LYGHE
MKRTPSSARDDFCLHESSASSAGNDCCLHESPASSARDKTYASSSLIHDRAPHLDYRHYQHTNVNHVGFKMSKETPTSAYFPEDSCLLSPTTEYLQSYEHPCKNNGPRSKLPVRDFPNYPFFRCDLGCVQVL